MQEHNPKKQTNKHGKVFTIFLPSDMSSKLLTIYLFFVQYIYIAYIYSDTHKWDDAVITGIERVVASEDIHYNVIFIGSGILKIYGHITYLYLYNVYSKYVRVVIFV
tara:strand:+ start:363 stop:683 length:321 start_codon:yes stop_codon:yes gene_type:complete